MDCALHTQLDLLAGASLMFVVYCLVLVGFYLYASRKKAVPETSYRHSTNAI
ncbi:p6 [Raspberry leaf mottle virus]|uniref:p6 n=1 Tax=Raspberry leaf mottle virus TaxID=326941 RepID=A0MBW6_9CLOS|nr:p6 [Raspberry leaf mottle virus]ABC87277.1 p6 [Raspberry leaf mottle virus]QRG29098.1 p6 [Raspberry leaf mottle virus]